MKKIISVLMVAVCLMMAAPAQAQLHFGVKGGLNLSKVSFSKSDLKGDNKTGWFIGPMAEFTLPIIGIGADVAALYSQTELAAKGYSTDAKLKTIEIPVNLKWSHSLLKLIGIYLAAGPDFSFNLKSDNIGSDLADIAVSTVQGDKASIKRKAANVGLNFGAGIILVKHLQVGFNYNLPLTSSAREDIKDGNVANAIGTLFDGDTFDTKNKKWQISVAYLF